MGEVEAKAGRGTRSDLRYDRHTASLLTDHLVFSPKYKGKVSLGEVAEVAEEITEKTAKSSISRLLTIFFFGLTGFVLKYSDFIRK